MQQVKQAGGPAAIAPQIGGAGATAQGEETVRPWRDTTWPVTVLALAVCTGILLALFWEDCRAAVEVWYASRTFNHCFLIGPISMYLIWERRKWLAAHPPVANFWGLLLFVPAGLIWLVGNFANVNEVLQFGVMTLFQAILLTVLGARIYRALLFPFLYLYFMVPAGGFLVPYLQDFTAAFIVHGLHVVGVPVLWDGVLITIPNGVFEVAEACAGLRFLIASVAFGFLFAFLMYYSRVRQAIFIVLSLTIPVIANGFRAFGIVMLAHLTDNRLAVGVDHLIYGWVFFSAITIVLIWVGSMFRDRPIVGRRFFAVGTGPARFDSPLRIGLVAVALLPLLALPKGYVVYVESKGGAGNLAALSPPTVAQPWRPIGMAGENWEPKPLGADKTVLQRYSDGERLVIFDLAYYVRQRRNAKVVVTEGRFVDDKTWHRNGGGQAQVTIDGMPLVVNTERIQFGDARRLIWYWYWVDGQFTASRLTAKLLEIKVSALGGNHSAAVVAIAADYRDNPAEATTTLQAFAGKLEPIMAMLRRASER